MPYPTIFKIAEIAHDVNVIINLTGKNIPGTDEIDVFDYILPNQELLDSEIPKTVKKLDTISDDMNKFYSAGASILILCEDGKNKSPLVAGIYAIDYLHKNIIDELERIYFTDLQRAEEFEDNGDFTPEKVKRRAERRQARCLTTVSFKKILKTRKAAR